MSARPPGSGFLCVVGGACITGFGMISGIEWPLWPVGLVLDSLRIADPYGERGGLAKLAILIALVAVNSAVWAAAIALFAAAIRKRSQH